MFLSAGKPELTQDHLDIAFDRYQDWTTSVFSEDMRSLVFAIGDPVCGGMVMLVNTAVRPGDEEKFPPIVHMHRSDSFRTFLNGDFYVGRKVYADGAARLQAGGTYYGPEQPGPDAIQNSRDIWSMLVFGDKRGHRVHPADKKYLPMLEAADEASSPFYEQLGVDASADEATSAPDIRTNIGLALKAGHADLVFEEAAAWPQIGDARAAVMSIGPTDSGPLVMGLSAAAGFLTAPAARWDTELLLTVMHGSAEVGGQVYGPGEMRLQASGTTMPAVAAGAQGLDAYLVIGDRRAAAVVDRADAKAVAWAREIAATVNALAQPLAAASVNA